MTNATRRNRYPDYQTVLRLDGINFPMNLRQIGKFERLNEISVNVFTTREDKPDGKIVPLYLTERKRDVHVNLFYLSDPRYGLQVGHLAWIRNLSRLVGSQFIKRKNKKYICDRCLHYFHSMERLSMHNVDCERMSDCAIVLPNEDNRWLSFRHYERKERLPYVVYADLECALEKEREETFSVGYYVRCVRDEDATTYKSYRGEDCMAWFARELNVLAHRAKQTLSAVVTMTSLTSDEMRSFWNANRCHICGEPFEPSDQRVRDHCHITGRYRGPAHARCNINFNNSFVIPVFFHNLSDYDAHFIIEEIANGFEGKVELLPLTKETYISFTKVVRQTSSGRGRHCVKLRFVDSCKFLSASLAKLVSYLDKNELRITRSAFSSLDDDDFEVLTRKGVFPYAYVDSVDRLRETELPPREAFYSSLTGESVSVTDYEHAVTVWQRFRIGNLGECSDLYLKTDVLLLADVFENFRDNCMRSYDLDPAHYYTLPGYTWDAMLKYTGVRFELLTDVDMLLFVERGVRGGLSQCSHRYARANNKYLASYDPLQASTYLMYYDVVTMRHAFRFFPVLDSGLSDGIPTIRLCFASQSDARF
ncbi:PREDICTED: uncharacterized protein LOC105556165 [Vollenhovia emeryi]|uniref:uncharacterized protein LOC105556165 n=1 Tax=Vollenhovia emeryi TaxID=411798 RepID=UPI0005F418D1|nr:PREDICTED: uncharacterized protein LOC105556165 [Vollenhovia emeryi]